MDALYENIGGKLKGLAKVILVFDAIACAIASLNFLFEGEVLTSFIVFVVGVVAAWVSTWLLYAFGELVERTAMNEEHTRNILHLLWKKQSESQAMEGKPAEPVHHAPAAATPAAAPAPETKQVVTQGEFWACAACGKKNHPTRNSCWSCGAKVSIHTEAPYRCGKCGQPGPFENFCPNCGSSIKFYNH